MFVVMTAVLQAFTLSAPFCFLSTAEWFMILKISLQFCTDRHHMQSRSKLLRRARRGSGHNSSFRHNCSFKVTRPDGAGGGSQCLIL